MKLFAVVFCIALMVNALSAAKKTKEEREEEKEAKAEERKANKIKVEVNLINQRLELMQKTVDNTWKLEPFIKQDTVDDIKNLTAIRDEQGQEDELQNILTEAVEKIDEVVAMQEEIEADLQETYSGNRQEMEHEERILTAIEDAVNNADIENRNLTEFSSLHKKLIAIHDEFKKYERSVKETEKEFLDKMFPRMKDCYNAITDGISDLCSYARKAIYDHKIFKPKDIEKITKVKNKLLEKLNKGLESKNKHNALNLMKAKNEKNYIKHYDVVDKHLKDIVVYLNPKAEAENEDEEEE